MPDAIPTMTSNTAPLGTASASTQLSAATYAWKAMDDNISDTYWSTTAAGKYPSWLMYNWGYSRIIDQYTIRARYGADRTGAPKVFKLQGYNGSTYSDLDSRSGALSEVSWGDNEQRTFNFTNKKSYVGYRLYVTNNNGGSYTEIAEFELIPTDTWTRIELAGIQIIGVNPKPRLDIAGIQIICVHPKPRILLAGVQAIYDTNIYVTDVGDLSMQLNKFSDIDVLVTYPSLGNMWLSCHF